MRAQVLGLGDDVLCGQALVEEVGEPVVVDTRMQLHRTAEHVHARVPVVRAPERRMQRPRVGVAGAGLLMVHGGGVLLADNLRDSARPRILRGVKVSA